jgi:hypothetical protein
MLSNVTQGNLTESVWTVRTMNVFLKIYIKAASFEVPSLRFLFSASRQYKPSCIDGVGC